MKRFIVALLIASIALMICGCQQQEKSTIPLGTYQPAEIIYLTPISSASMDYFLEQNKLVFFAIEKDVFSIEVPEEPGPLITSQDYPDVTYVEEIVSNTLSIGEGQIQTIDLSEFASKTAFHVYSDEVDTGYTIYCMDDEVWISYLNAKSKPLWADYVFVMQKAYFD